MTARVIVTALLAGCGETYPEPKQANVQAQAAVRTAERLGANRDPRAATFLGYARGEIRQAQMLISDGHFHRAALVLARARADAELAMTLAAVAGERTQAERVIREVNDIRSRLPKEDQ